MGGASAATASSTCGSRFSGRESAERADDEVLRAEAVPGADLRRRRDVGRGQRIGDAHRHGVRPPPRARRRRRRGQRGAVHRR